MNGNGNLCRAVVRAGACLGVMNKDGASIFNIPVATKQLLFKLLGRNVQFILTKICYSLFCNSMGILVIAVFFFYCIIVYYNVFINVMFNIDKLVVF